MSQTRATPAEFDASSHVSPKAEIGRALPRAGVNRPPRIFRLERRFDPSGVSGVGSVAEGALFSDGTAVLRWRGLHPTTTFFDSLDDVIRIHGHGGTTHVTFDEPMAWVFTTSQEEREGTE